MYDSRKVWIIERDPNRWTDDEWCELVRLILEQEEDDFTTSDEPLAPLWWIPSDRSAGSN